MGFWKELPATAMHLSAGLAWHNFGGMANELPLMWVLVVQSHWPRARAGARVSEGCLVFIPSKLFAKVDPLFQKAIVLSSEFLIVLSDELSKGSKANWIELSKHTIVTGLVIYETYMGFI